MAKADVALKMLPCHIAAVEKVSDNLAQSHVHETSQTLIAAAEMKTS